MTVTKILHIIQWHCLGGAARAMMATAKYSTQFNPNFKHSILSLKPSAPQAKALAEEVGIPVIDAPDREALDREIENADIVQVHFWNNPQMYEFLRADLPPMRLIMWFHVAGEHPPQVITRDLVDYADFAIPCNPYSYELPVFQTLPVERRLKKVGMVYDAADFARVGETQPKAHETFNVGFIGSLSFAKMHRNYVSMSAKVEVPNVRFIACGGGALDFLKQEAQSLGALEKFEFRGFVEDIKSAIEVFDVYGYPLCEDTYAAAELNLQEVMYGGVPPVVFPYGGVRRLVIDNYTGFVVHSELEYKQAIEHLYHHPEDRKRLGRNAKEYAKQIFGAENAAQKLNPIYEKLIQLPKHKREWGIPHDYSLLEQPLSLRELMGMPGRFPGAESFIESLGETAPQFTVSLYSKDLDQLFEADAKIAASSILLSRGEGGISQYRSYYPKDGYLHFWLGLALQRSGQYREAIATLIAATKLGCDHWRVSWYLAQIAEKIGDFVLSEQALNTVSSLAPNFIPAREMLARIQRLKGQSQQVKEALAQQLSLREANLVIFPNWKQPEEILLQDLATALKAVSTRRDPSHLTLLLDTQGIAEEEVELAVSSAVMHLLMEEGVELSEEIEVSPIGELSTFQWQALLSCLKGRIILPGENRQRISEVGVGQIPGYTPEQLSDRQLLLTELEQLAARLNLREVNLVAFPDWTQSEDELLQALVSALKAVSTYKEPQRLTLLIDAPDISDEDVELALSSAVMALLMEEGIELSEQIEVTPVRELSANQWQDLISCLQGRIALPGENQQRIVEVGGSSLPNYTLEQLSEL